jgi:hypothetical protein
VTPKGTSWHEIVSFVKKIIKIGGAVFVECNYKKKLKGEKLTHISVSVALVGDT